MPPDMTTMVERVARAIKAMPLRVGGYVDVEDVARAAIEAIERELCDECRRRLASPPAQPPTREVRGQDRPGGFVGQRVAIGYQDRLEGEAGGVRAGGSPGAAR